MRILVFGLLAVAISGCQGGRDSDLTDSVAPAADSNTDLFTSRDSYPLLGSTRAAFVWEEFCQNNPDEAALPADPRSLIVPGANEDRAVFFNAYYQDCHVALEPKEQGPKTCGEYWTSRNRGEAYMLGKTGREATIAAADFDSAWQNWGMDARPDNYEQLYTLRYGQNPAPYHNPYPLDGEDPNASNGGSGQLPMGFTQARDTDGQWTGMIANVSCYNCHAGQMGDPYADEDLHIGFDNMGLGNANVDSVITASENTVGPVQVASPDVLNLGVKQRGTNNAVGAFEVLFAVLDYDSLGVSGNLNKAVLRQGHDLSHPTAVVQDTPPWWNFSARARKFFDAGVSSDAQRILLAAGSISVSADGKDYRDHIEEYDQDVAWFLASRTSPKYPGEIDEALAEQGAILFHAKNLWAADANANSPRPLGGNGSCASCHGAYSPRFVNDPSFLENPAFAGMAAHISPLEVIGTDSARTDTLTPYLRDAYSTTFWAYPEDKDGWIAPENKDPVSEILDEVSTSRPEGACSWERGVIGYQAPPLHGTWATAPYFHNGSVPTIEAVLDSSKRSAIWQRPTQTIDGITGFDQSLTRAYDWDALGWKHTSLSCDEMPGQAEFNCNPIDDQGPSLLQLAENLLLSNFNWVGLTPSIDPDTIDKRFIYDTRRLGNGAQGHEFSDALSDRERAAIIEYLKTL
ncbi:MAG: putative rubber dioxygenase RoxC [Oceanococcus sp.]